MDLFRWRRERDYLQEFGNSWWARKEPRAILKLDFYLPDLLSAYACPCFLGLWSYFYDEVVGSVGVLCVALGGCRERRCAHMSSHVCRCEQELIA